jgi:hypothetical protein
MRLHANKLVLILVGVIIAWFGAASSKSKEVNKIVIPLRLNEQYEQFAGFEINFGDNKSGSSRLGRAPGGVLVAVEKLPDSRFTYRIKVDSDGDGNLNSELAQDVLPNAFVIVRVNRKWANGKQQILPYIIKYSRYVDGANEIQESFLWISHYRAEGRLRIKNCEALLVVLDLNGDSLFNQRDFSAGTSIGLDRNGDGRIWGSNEWLKGRQIIDFCGASLLIDGLEVDGSSVTLIETALRVLKIGDPLPTFSLITDEGKTMDSSRMKEKIFLLDFWASWCQPCVEKFVYVKPAVSHM